MVSISPTSSTGASSPSPVARSSNVYHIFAGKLFDSHSRKLVPKQAITIDRDSGTILKVQDVADFWAESERRRLADNGVAEEIVDLMHLTVLPGFVDAHVHMFLHAYKETSWNDQLTKESLAERTLRAGAHARKTLMAGFTTVRDLGTEGAEDADIALRKCLAVLPDAEGPIIPGPRYYCSSRAIVSTGSYGPKSSLFPSQNVVEGVTGAEAADGVEGCIRAVRRQIGTGADWIKIYADYRVRSRMSDVSPSTAWTSTALFTNAELRAMIDTAHAHGVKVAAHTNTPGVIEQLLDLGVDSIEHGSDLFLSDAHGTRAGATLIEKWASLRGTTVWVPTLAVVYTLGQQGLHDTAAWERTRRSFEKVLQVGGAAGAGPGREGIRIACGGDTGAFPHGENGLEMVLMRRLGAEWGVVLGWATLGGWECVRGMEWEGERGEARVRSVEEGQGLQGAKARGKSNLERGCRLARFGRAGRAIWSA
ncbi:putative amidohydrolase family protein [Lyophyllum shimeji]|uniref:Amidohydrolase family protein n=1 Tax=Lyophyllum shimeji TaxID=47721 RepID=A0A9P3PY87_LYOSH|nr:putative amidohydrolase family protein [Lyophyllum shimeji]